MKDISFMRRGDGTGVTGGGHKVGPNAVVIFSAKDSVGHQWRDKRQAVIEREKTKEVLMKIIYKHILPLLLIILPAINLRPEQGTA